VLLCDEPTGALDVQTGKIVLEAIARVNRELGTTTAVITHNAVIAAMAAWRRVIHAVHGLCPVGVHRAEVRRTPKGVGRNRVVTYQPAGLALRMQTRHLSERLPSNWRMLIRVFSDGKSTEMMMIARLWPAATAPASKHAKERQHLCDVQGRRACDRNRNTLTLHVTQAVTDDRQSYSESFTRSLVRSRMLDALLRAERQLQSAFYGCNTGDR
jgi:ABC-type sulfate/molybdate transport systems ATPase subunit